MTNNSVYEHFDSINSFINAITTRKFNSAHAYDQSSNDTDRSFFMTGSFDEAMNLFTKGWDEPLEEIKKGVEKNFKANTTRVKNLPRTGIVGYAPCVPNAILGLPNSMISTERVPTKIKAITMVYSVSVTAKITAKQLHDAGISVLNIINNLELAGYRVKLDVEFVSTEIYNILHTVRINVKDWRQPLDIKKLTFPIAHPSAFRRMGWRWLETSPAVTYGGYGSSNFKSNYRTALATYKKRNLLADNEYLLTTYLCMDKNYNEEEIMRACGLSALETKRG